MICRKCGNTATLMIRKEYCYCDNCFGDYVNHKFRACIGKNKILSSNERVLICLSGKRGSTVLLDLIYNGMLMDSHKKLRITPFFMHITGIGDKESNKKTSNLIIEQCMTYNFNVYIINLLEYYFQKKTDLPKVNSISSMTSDCETQLHSDIATSLKNMSHTISDDFVSKIKVATMIEVAKKLECKFVFTAETTTDLAAKLLTNLTIGRGAQVEYDIPKILSHVPMQTYQTDYRIWATSTTLKTLLYRTPRVLKGFMDKRDVEVRILKPMRDVSEEEAEKYVHMKNLSVIKENKPQNSIQSVIRCFVSNLQDNYPATISTVCKTADKLSSDEGRHIKKCVICKSDIDIKRPLTAIEATNFSRNVSFGRTTNTNNDCDVANLDDIEVSNKFNAMFPFLNEYFCYCCSRNYSEISNSKLQKHIKNIIQNSSLPT